VAVKIKIEKAKTRISRNIASLHYIVPVRVGNIGSLTIIREALQLCCYTFFTLRCYAGTFSDNLLLPLIWPGFGGENRERGHLEDTGL